MFNQKVTKSKIYNDILDAIEILTDKYPVGVNVHHKRTASLLIHGILPDYSIDQIGVALTQMYQKNWIYRHTKISDNGKQMVHYFRKSIKPATKSVMKPSERCPFCGAMENKPKPCNSDDVDWMYKETEYECGSTEEKQTDVCMKREITQLKAALADCQKRLEFFFFR